MARPVITDTHCHVYAAAFDADREEMLLRAHASGVSRMLVVGTDVDSSRACFALAARHAGLFPTAGIHPHDAERSDAAARAEIESLCRASECVAVGETGLDWFKQFSPRAEQLENFRWHARLARELDKPLVVHCRDAHEDTLAVLREFRGVRGVMHCYTMGVEELAPYLELGFFISFSGVVTYPKNERNQAAARAVPLERLLVETDAPYLAPQGRRGQRNEPAHARLVLEELARLRGADSNRLALDTSDNAGRLFDLRARPPA